MRHSYAVTIADRTPPAEGPLDDLVEVVMAFEAETDAWQDAVQHGRQGHAAR